MIPPVPSLVSYDKPVLVSSSKDAGKIKKGKYDSVKVDKKSKTLQTEDVLNAILPPRCALRKLFVETVLIAFFVLISEWTEDGELWVSYVSAAPPTRTDAITLGVRRFYHEIAIRKNQSHL